MSTPSAPTRRIEHCKRRVDEATAVWVQAWREAADAEKHEAKTRQVMLAARRRYEAAMRHNAKLLTGAMAQGF